MDNHARCKAVVSSLNFIDSGLLWWTVDVIPSLSMAAPVLWPTVHLSSLSKTNRKTKIFINREESGASIHWHRPGNSFMALPKRWLLCNMLHFHFIRKTKFSTSLSAMFTGVFLQSIIVWISLGTSSYTVLSGSSVSSKSWDHTNELELANLLPYQIVASNAELPCPSLMIVHLAWSRLCAKMDREKIWDVLCEHLRFLRCASSRLDRRGYIMEAADVSAHGKETNVFHQHWYPRRKQEQNRLQWNFGGGL